MNPQLTTNLKRLRLSGMIGTLEVRLQEAQGNQLSHLELLELLVNDELAVRNDRAIARRIKAAGFRDNKTLEDFDWTFNTSVKRSLVFELATGAFIREQRDLLWLGPPGVGKSHLVQAIGRQAARVGFTVLYRSIFDAVQELMQAEAFSEIANVMRRYLKPDLLIFDNVGLKHLPRNPGECLCEIVMRRYELQSTMMTSNRRLEDWGKVLGNVLTATAILDRFLHYDEVIQITRRSYHLKDRALQENSKKAN